MASRRLEVVIAGDASGATRALGQLENRAERTGRSMQGLRRVGGALAGVFAGIQVGNFLRGAIAEAEEAQRVMAQTNAVIESTGGVAGVTADHLADLAGELSNIAAVDDEVIQQGGNVLLTFKNIKAEGGIFDDALAASLDMSAALGTQLQPNVLAVGKALNDPIAGLGRLTRMGVDFTEAQKDQIEAMVAFGDVAGAQRVILDELATQFGGAAEANATASERMTVAWDNIKEQIGLILLPAFDAAADAVSRLADLFQSMPESAQVAVLAIGGVVTAAGVLAAVLSVSFGAALAAVAGVAAIAAGVVWLGEQFPEAKKKAMLFFDSMVERWDEFQKQLTPVKDAIQGAIDKIREFFASATFDTMKESVERLIETLGKFKDDIGLTGSTGQTAIFLLTTAFKFLGGLIYATITVVTVLITQLAFVGSITLSVVRFAVAALAGFVQAVVSAARSAWEWLTKLGNLNISVGGLGSMRDLLASAAGAAQQIWSALSNFVGRTFSVNIDFPSPPSWLPFVESSGGPVGAAVGGGVAAITTAALGGPVPAITPALMSGQAPIVITAPQSAPSINVTVNGTATAEDGQAVVDALRRWQQRNGPVPVRVSA